MAEMVEHQATVDTGLKMKIKRKNPTAKSCESKCKTAEDKNGNLKNRKTKSVAAQNSANDAAISLPADEKLSDSTAVASEERPQKRKRNAKPSRLTKVQNGEDCDSTKGSRAAKPELETPRVNNPTNTTKDKAKTGKISTTEKPGAGDKPSRKRCAPTASPLSSSNNTCDNAKPKITRITVSDRDQAEDKPVELRRSGHPGIKTEADDSQRKSDAKIHAQQDDVSCSNSTDPYEFVAKVEDTIQTPVKKFKSEKADGPGDQLIAGGSPNHQDTGTEMCTVGVTTDPDCLGPCEPGTSVILEGIVWSESNNGILVVNVTWRGKTYVGTLMDTTKHNWASPRFCEASPVPDLDWRLPKSKRACVTPVAEVLEGRRLRKCRRNVAPSNGCTNSKVVHPTSRQSPVNSDTNVSRRRGRTLENLECLSSCVSQVIKKSGDVVLASNESLLECNSVNCKKKFKHISGLNYHQSHAHRKAMPELPSDSGTKMVTSAERVSEIASEVRNVESEVGSENSENVTISSELSSKVEVATFETNIKDVVQSVAENTANLPETASLPDSSSSLLTFGSNNVLPETLHQAPKENVLSALSPESCDVLAVSKLYDASAEISKKSCSQSSGRNGACAKVSDSKDDEDNSPVLPCCDTDKTQFADVGTNAAIDSFSHLSNSSCGKSVSARNGNSDAAIEDHPASKPSAESLSDVVIINLARDSPRLVVNSDDKSSTYSDISEPNDAVGASYQDATRLLKKEVDAKVHPKQGETKHQKMKQDIPGSSFSVSHSAGSTVHAANRLHASLPNGGPRPQNSKPKDVDPTRKKDCSVSAANSFAKMMATPEDKRPRKWEFTDAEVLATSREPKTCQEHFNAFHASTVTAAATSGPNAVPYDYTRDHNNAYQIQFLAQNSETRSHYDRWIAEHGHHYVQQQQCFNKPITVDADNIPPPESKPVDMSSKGQTIADKSDSSSLPSRMKLSAQKSVENKVQVKSEENAWIPLPTKYQDVPPAAIGNGIRDSCSDQRNFSGDKLSVPKDRIEGTRLHDHKHRERGDRTVGNRIASVNLSQGSGSPDHSESSVTPISKSLNLVGSISPYSSGNPSGFLKNFIHDPRHPSLIGYGGSVSYMDWSQGSSPNSKLLDLDSKQVVSGSNHHRSTGGGDARHALDVLRYQSVMFGKAGSEPKLDQANISRDFVEKELNHPGKDAANGQRENGELSDQCSSLTLRHLHTHHHTHLVGAAYPIYGSYNGLISPVPAMVPSVPPVIPSTYLPK